EADDPEQESHAKGKRKPTDGIERNIPHARRLFLLEGAMDIDGDICHHQAERDRPADHERHAIDARDKRDTKDDQGAQADDRRNAATVKSMSLLRRELLFMAP